MLKAANEDTYGYDVRMYSSEYGTTTNRPYLEVTYRLEYKKAFYMKDHLGNIRVTMDEAGNVIGGNDYYPFGLQMPGRSYVAGNYQNTYKYSGKELDEEQFSNGTTMGAIDWYYFGARYYDPEIGRWYVVDAFSEKAPSWTPYNYTFNNPYKYVDADGNFPFLFIGALALYAVLSAPGPVNAPSPADVENGNLYKAQTNEEFAIEAGLKVAALLTIATATSDATSTPIENADDQPEQPALPDKAEDSKEGPYDRPANRDEQGRPQPDPKAEGPHSTLSTRKGEKQGHTFNEEGQLETEVSPNDKRHGPHQHNYDNSDPKNPARGKVKQIKKE
jgi:RHS repeat-associated protein